MGLSAAERESFLENGFQVVPGLALQPSFTIRRFRASAACNHPAYLAGRERTYEGLRMAGVPEE